MNAYVLIGGRSQRMGTSKAALFLDRVAAAAANVFDSVVAVQRAGGDVPFVRTPLRTICESAHEAEGPVFGVLAALRDAEGPAFVLAVDYPLVTSELLQFLREREGVPVWNGFPQPLCAVWPGALLPVIEERIASGILDLQSLRRNDMIPESELRARFGGEPLWNVNTPDDLEKAERLYGERFFSSR